MSDNNLNPYAAPIADSTPEPTGGDAAAFLDDNGVEHRATRACGRDRSLLFVCKGSYLVECCVKCNEPAVRLRKHTLYWHDPGFYFFSPLLSPFVYLIVMLRVRQSTLRYRLECANGI